MASPVDLRDYDLVVPGSAAEMMAAHLRRREIAADAIRRLTIAEARSVMIGVLGAPVLLLTSLAAAIVFVASGFPLASLLAIAPSSLTGLVQVMGVARRRSG